MLQDFLNYLNEQGKTVSTDVLLGWCTLMDAGIAENAAKKAEMTLLRESILDEYTLQLIEEGVL